MTLLFNTFAFWNFFALVYVLYILLPHRWQNRMLLVASYVFYGSWDWRFLGLIILSTAVDYVAGLRIEQAHSQHTRRVWLLVSVCTNLGMLGFFKYFHFFAESFIQLAEFFSWTPDIVTLTIILPVGISFYTFQTLSYTIDVYRRRIRATHHFFDFALFVAFFPQLVAGPIERASHLLPQVLNPRQVSDARNIEGIYLIVWGLFKKVVIADTLAQIVDPVFAASSASNGLEVLIALYAFAWQIYGDFSGYSDIARGLSRLLGFELMLNFHVPYFAKNPSEFWQRWHISLSTWLRDYLYIPLGGNRHGSVATLRNLALTMLLGGLWHGAAWTFVLWGAWHGFLLIAHRLLRETLSRFTLTARSAWDYFSIIFFFHCVLFGWLLFRAQSFSQVVEFSRAVTSSYTVTPMAVQSASMLLFLLTFLVIIQYRQWKSDDTLIFFRLGRAERISWVAGAVFVTLYVVFSATAADLGGGREFIYFQF